MNENPYQSPETEGSPPKAGRPLGEVLIIATLALVVFFLILILLG